MAEQAPKKSSCRDGACPVSLRSGETRQAASLGGSLRWTRVNERNGDIATVKVWCGFALWLLAIIAHQNVTHFTDRTPSFVLNQRGSGTTKGGPRLSRPAPCKKLRKGRAAPLQRDKAP